MSERGSVKGIANYPGRSKTVCSPDGVPWKWTSGMVVTAERGIIGGDERSIGQQVVTTRETSKRRVYHERNGDLPMDD